MLKRRQQQRRCIMVSSQACSTPSVGQLSLLGALRGRGARAFRNLNEESFFHSLVDGLLFRSVRSTRYGIRFGAVQNSESRSRVACSLFNGALLDRRDDVGHQVPAINVSPKRADGVRSGGLRVFLCRDNGRGVCKKLKRLGILAQQRIDETIRAYRRYSNDVDGWHMMTECGIGERRTRKEAL